MMRALDDVPKEAEASLQRGCSEALRLLEGFWMGLEEASNNVEYVESRSLQLHLNDAVSA